MTLVSVITSSGKNNLLATGFYGGSGNTFRYMAAGKGDWGGGNPTEAATALNSECTSGDGSYARVALTNTFETANKRVKSEGTFLTTNITNSTTLTEIGIADATSTGVFFCICQIPDTVKDSTKELKFTILTTFA